MGSQVVGSVGLFGPLFVYCQDRYHYVQDSRLFYLTSHSEKRNQIFITHNNIIDVRRKDCVEK